MCSPLKLRCQFVVLGLAFALLAPTISAQEPELPVRRVILFTTGVGFFEHQGKVEGTVEVELPFALTDVDDLLKTLVLQDQDGGHVPWISYAAAQSLDEQLANFNVDIAAAPTLGELLQQLRGEQISLKTRDGGDALAGQIVGLELRDEITADGVAEREFLNLLTQSGLQSLALRDVQSFQLADAQVQEQLAKALETVAKGRREDKRLVRFGFRGEGQRNVRLAYLRQTPVWKTTHRLVLEHKAKPPAQFQSWAIVENTGETDWEQVELRLVSGNPISYSMPLETPHYVQRPRVSLPIAGIPTPRSHHRSSRLNRPFVTGIVPVVPSAMGGGGMGGGFGGGGTFGGPATSSGQGRMDPTQGIRPQTKGGAVGEFFQFTVDTPVSLAKSRSALIPLSLSPVDAERVSVFTPKVDAKQLLLGVRLKNTSSGHWAAGPVTVMDDGGFAGESQIEHTRPGEQRLATYAADLEVEARVEPLERSTETTRFAIRRGRLDTGLVHSRMHHYRFHNLSEQDKTLIVEHPAPADDFETVPSDEFLEATDSHHRYRLVANGGKPAELKITERYETVESTPLASLSDVRLAAVMRNPVATDALKKDLEKLINLRAQLLDLQRQRQDVEARNARLTQGQARVRENMRNLDRTSELYQKYVAQLTKEEDEFRTLRAKQDELESEIKAVQTQVEALAPTGLATVKEKPASNDDPFK